MMFWQQWVPLLATSTACCGLMHVVAVTSKPPAGSRMSFEQLAGDAIGLMDKLDIGRVHWVGESSAESSA